MLFPLARLLLSLSVCFKDAPTLRPRQSRPHDSRWIRYGRSLLPNHWVIGAVIGVAVDGKDNVWIIHRESSLEAKEKYATWSPRASECCVPAPAVLQFNQAGDLVGSWGGPGPGYEWPSSNHGIDIDHKGNVWIGGNGRGQQQAALATDESKMAAAGTVHDSMLLKFTQSGKFLMQIGQPNRSKGSNDTENLRLPAKSLVDPKTNELYVADGYGNRRVIVYDADSGKYKRHWGAYGSKPDDTDWVRIGQLIRQPSNSGLQCTRSLCHTMDCFTSVTAPMIASRYSRLMGHMSKRRSSRKILLATDRPSM